MGVATTHSGALPNGANYVLERPGTWNGVLLLTSHPVPVGPGAPPWKATDPLIKRLVSDGYAVAGAANTIFWPLQQMLGDHPSLIDVTTDLLGPPRHTINMGLSIGGIISAAAVQAYPHRLSGALPMCGNLAGAVANHNRELDMAFVVKTLLASDTPLEIVNITKSIANVDLAQAIMQEAQATPEGRARLALVAAVGNMPGGYDPRCPEPAAGDFEARQGNQVAWFKKQGFDVLFMARKQVEMQAGGNGSWNTNVDYRELLSRSIARDEADALYRAAKLDLEEDLERLASAPRIEADPAAVRYLEDHIVFNGDLGGIPVLTMHTDGDGLVIPDHEHAYRDVVRHAGQEQLLRQLYVHRGGHCTFTLAEVLTALGALMHRIESGSWPPLDGVSLNEAAHRMGAPDNILLSGEPADSAFVPFEPRPFARPHDVRHVVR